MYTNSGINKNTQEILLEPIKIDLKDKEYLKKLGELYFKLNNYTMKRDRLFLPFMIRRQFVNISDENEEFSRYKDDDFDFYFGLLSDRIDNRRLIKELKCKKRYHKCHEASIGINLNDEENNLRILTGYVPTINEEVLHSVVEMKDENITYIIDYTQNLVMKKEDYIKINQFRILNEVSSEELKSDSKTLESLPISCPLYLVFRKELMKDLKKNSKVLKLED